MYQRRVATTFRPGKSSESSFTVQARPTLRNKQGKRRKQLSHQASIIVALFKKDGTLADHITLAIQIVCGLVLVTCGLTLFIKWCASASLSSLLNPLSWVMFGSGVRRHGKYDLVPLKPSDIYTIPQSMSHIGDKSDGYARLRKEVDAIDIPLVEQKYTFSSKAMDAIEDDQVSYDIYNCPENPPHGYPYVWRIVDILDAWPADNTEPREQVYQGLCVFDYEKDYETAERYRKAELPFVVRNDPNVALTAARWNNYPGYMHRMLGKVMHRAEHSMNNHFMYWNKPSKKPPSGRVPRNEKNLMAKSRPFQYRIQAPEGWEAPTKALRMTYDEWVTHANVTEAELGPDQPHWYFRLIACGETGPQGQCDAGSSEYIYDELPYFQPKESLYVVEPDEQKGIHCRFGMKGRSLSYFVFVCIVIALTFFQHSHTSSFWFGLGVIAENHFDAARNAIALLGGERRYILSHPDQCHHLALYPKGHPSGRHSAVDWSDPDLEAYPEFSLAKGNEVVMQAGDVM